MLDGQEPFLREGTIIGKSYEIDYALGKGGFGITYKAIDHDLHRYVAIKEFFPSEWAWRSKITQSVLVSKTNHDIYQKLLSKFEEEGRILAKLDHPNIVRVYSLFRSLGTVYLVMELLEGRTLSDEIANTIMSSERIEKIAKTLALALHIVHKSGIQHLDIKPDNIMLTNDGRIVLYDFGAAHWDLDEVKKGQSQTITAYTPGYAPLELLQGHRARTTPATDIYQLSVVIYEMLTGKRPPDPLERLNMSEVWEPEVPDEWKELLVSGLALKIEDRPTSIVKWWKLYKGNREGKDLAKTQVKKKADRLTTLSRLLGKFGFSSFILGIACFALVGIFLFKLNSTQYYWFMARRAKATENYTNAIVYYNHVINHLPDNLEARLERAEVHFQLGNYLEAIHDYDYVYSMNKDSALRDQIGLAYLRYVELVEKDGKMNLAIEYLEKAKRYNPKLESEIYSKMLDILLLSAQMELENKNYQKVVDIYRKILRDYQSDSGITKQVKQRLGRTYLMLGKEQESKGDIKSAVNTYTAGIKEHPYFNELHETRGTLYIKLNQLNKALSDYNRSIELNQDAAISYAGRAYILGRFGRFKDALKDYDKAIALGLNTDYVYYGRGWIHQQMSNYARAISDYNQAIDINPDHTQSYLNRGWVKYYISDYDNAISDFNKVIEKNDNVASAYQGLGYAKTMLGDSEVVILDHLRKAVELYRKEGNQIKVLEIKSWIKKHNLGKI